MEWHNERRKISDLITMKNNPRRMTDKQVADLKASLEKFNLAEIPAINTDNTILAGHQRLKIMILLERGNEEIDVRVPDRLLTSQEANEYCIRSNKNAGEFDFDMLANNFEIDDLLNWGFDSKELGIDDSPIPELETIELKAYKKIHILLSFPPAKFDTIKELLEEIKKLEGVEYEQSAN